MSLLFWGVCFGIDYREAMNRSEVMHFDGADLRGVASALRRTYGMIMFGISAHPPDLSSPMRINGPPTGGLRGIAQL